MEHCNVPRERGVLAPARQVGSTDVQLCLRPSQGLITAAGRLSSESNCAGTCATHEQPGVLHGVKTMHPDQVTLHVLVMFHRLILGQTCYCVQNHCSRQSCQLAAQSASSTCHDLLVDTRPACCCSGPAAVHCGWPCAVWGQSGRSFGLRTPTSSFCPAHVAAGVRTPRLRLRHDRLLHVNRAFTRSSYRLVDAGFACRICEGCTVGRTPEALSICSAVPGHRSRCTLRVLHVCSHTTVKQARYGAYRHAQRHISLR